MKKWVWSIIGVVVATIVSLLWFYNITIDEYHSAERKAIKWALQLTSLTEVDHVRFFAGETNYTIVFGNNDEGENVVVWVNDEEYHEETISANATEAIIHQHVIERNGSVNLVHITPGRLGDLWVWEVFYKKQEEQGTRHYYDYYHFKDGNWIETYRLSLEP